MTAIEAIAPEEIEAAVLLVVEKEFGIDLESLTVQASRLFAFKRAGKKIQAAFRNAARRLLKAGKITNENGGLRLTASGPSA